MQVILLKDVDGVGEAGAVVEVSDGYARNYLLPKKLATIATSRKVKSLEKQRQAVMERIKKEQKASQTIAQQLSEVELRIEKQAGEEGKLFGSVTKKEISDTLNAKGFKIDKKQVVLEEPIKALGEYQVEIKLPHGQSAKIKVEVVAGE
jgi:large subunit ribosomal protein L9